MTFSERLWVPWWWWAFAVAMALSAGLAVGAFIGAAAGWAATAGACLLVITLLLAYGSFEIKVDERGLHAGRAVLEWEWMGQATSQNVRQTDDLLGREADLRAWLATRPYVNTSVRVGVVDAADPHPYWLVSARRAPELAAALQAGVRQEQ